jgi:hypothetical protein
MTDQHSALSLDGATVLALKTIREKGTGLFSQVLILTDGAVDFSNDETSYRSPVYEASSGGSDTFLKASEYPNKDEAKLSGRDSEVAALQEAWDWLSAHNAQSVLVVLVCNIGPCNACKQRLTNFRAECARYYGANLTVQVIYGQSGASAMDTTRGDKKIKTTYGYQNAGAHTLSNQQQVWVHTVT